jgi:hypothetical protein
MNYRTKETKPSIETEYTTLRQRPRAMSTMSAMLPMLDMELVLLALVAAGVRPRAH